MTLTRPSVLVALLVLGCASAPKPARAPVSRAPAPTASPLDDMMRGDIADDQAIVWSAGRRLSWEDFQADPPTEGQEGAMTSYTIYSAWKCRGDAFEFRVVAGFRPRQSWVKPVVLNDTTQRRTVLRHEQTHFDLAEVHARGMRRALNNVYRPCRRPDRELSDLVQGLAQAEKAEQRRYDAETKHGLLGAKQVQWSRDVAARLERAREGP